MRIPVFMSYSSPYTQKQEQFIQAVKKFLMDRGFEPRTLGVTDYDMEEPLTAVRRMLLESNGLIAIAFRRGHIIQGIENEGNKEREKSLNDQYFSSPWCQIEPAMAYQLGLPILIFREKGVMANGILEKGVAGTYLPEFDLKISPKKYLATDEWLQIVGTWEGYVRSVRKAKGKPPQLY